MREAAPVDDWTMAHPDLSFNEHGLMYGETEGGMMEFTMFNNMPCWARMYAGWPRWRAVRSRRSLECRPTVWARRSCATASGTKVEYGKVRLLHDPSLTTWASTPALGCRIGRARALVRAQFATPTAMTSRALRR